MYVRITLIAFNFVYFCLNVIGFPILIVIFFLNVGILCHLLHHQKVFRCTGIIGTFALSASTPSPVCVIGCSFPSGVLFPSGNISMGFPFLSLSSPFFKLPFTLIAPK